MMHPAFDCPVCPSCGGKLGIGDSEGLAAGWLRCVGCGHEWEATPEDLEQAARADAAWRALEDEAKAAFDRGEL